jgi:hypothetical protein
MGRYDRQRRRHPGLANRAQRQGRISTGPDRRAAQRQIRHIRGQTAQQRQRIQRQGQSAARSARKTSGREASFERGIAGNLKGLGEYKTMTRRQLMQGANQVENYGQGLAHLARKGAQLDIRNLNQQSREDIYNTRQSVQGIQRQATAQALSSLLTQHRQARASRLQDAQQSALDKLKNERQRHSGRIQDALGAVGDLLKTDPTPPKNEKEWGQFSSVLQQQNPLMHPHAIEEAINRYRTHETTQLINYWSRIFGSLG